MYCIAGNFRRRKLLRIGEKYVFRGENFRLLPRQRTPHPNFAKKTLAYSHKTVKFAKVFCCTVMFVTSPANVLPVTYRPWETSAEETWRVVGCAGQQLGLWLPCHSVPGESTASWYRWFTNTNSTFYLRRASTQSRGSCTVNLSPCEKQLLVSFNTSGKDSM